MRRVEIKFKNKTAGMLLQDEDGYHFIYEENYLNLKNH